MKNREKVPKKHVGIVVSDLLCGNFEGFVNGECRPFGLGRIRRCCSDSEVRPTVHLSAVGVASSAGSRKGERSILLELVQRPVTGMSGEIKALGLTDGEKVTLNSGNINLPLRLNRGILFRRPLCRD